MRNSFILFLFFTFSSLFCQNSLSDILPLDVGNKWVYNYWDHYQNVMPHGETKNDGIIEYKITGKENYVDSTVWHFVHKSETHRWVSGIYGWSTYKDSSYFDIVEINNLNHQLISSTFSEKSVFLFARTHIENLKFYRMYTTNIQGKSFYTFDYKNSTANERFLVDKTNFVCSKDSGITYLESYKSYTTSNWVKSFTLNKFLRQNTSSVENYNSNVPTSFSLSQNYPNPFNPETTIEYSIPANVKGRMAKVTLKVYDLLGREVATLVDEYKQPGSYNSKFSIVNYKLPSGVYFYRLQCGNYVQTKKLVLLK